MISFISICSAGKLSFLYLNGQILLRLLAGLLLNNRLTFFDFAQGEEVKLFVLVREKRSLGNVSAVGSTGKGRVR